MKSHKKNDVLRLLAEKQRLIAECDEYTSNQRRQLEVTLPQSQNGGRHLISQPQGRVFLERFICNILQYFYLRSYYIIPNGCLSFCKSVRNIYNNILFSQDLTYIF